MHINPSAKIYFYAKKLIFEVGVVFTNTPQPLLRTPPPTTLPPPNTPTPHAHARLNPDLTSLPRRPLSPLALILPRCPRCHTTLPLLHRRRPCSTPEVRTWPRQPQRREQGRRWGALPSDHGPTRRRQPLPTYSHPPPRFSRNPPEERIRPRWPRSGEQGRRGRALRLATAPRWERWSSTCHIRDRHTSPVGLLCPLPGGFHDAGHRIGLHPSHLPLSFTNLSDLVIIFTFPIQIWRVWGELVTSMPEGLAAVPPPPPASSTSLTTQPTSPTVGSQATTREARFFHLSANDDDTRPRHPHEGEAMRWHDVAPHLCA